MNLETGNFFVITTSTFDAPTGTSFYSSTSGRTGTAPSFTGAEPNSSKLRGYLLAATQGLKFLFETSGKDHPIDLLVPDADIARIIRNHKPGRRLLHGDADSHWEAFHKVAELFNVRVLENHSESELLLAYWNWHSRPAIPAAAPPFRQPYRAPVVVTPPAPVEPRIRWILDDPAHPYGRSARDDE